MILSRKGKSAQKVLSELTKLKENDVDWHGGKCFGYVYNIGDKESELLRDAANLYQHESALDLSAFPSSAQLEREVISMALGLLNGGPHSEGSFTSGGTESILLSVKSARDYARAEKGITNPNIIIPTTAHPAFIKACEYFGVAYKAVNVCADTYKAIPENMENFIDENTILLVASAPSYGTGTMDPIEEIGQVALRNKVLFTVDACMGGMVLPFLKDAGYHVPNFDLSVPGVSSISVDFHKYGYANKGSSAILYNDGKVMRKHQMFVCSSWMGYSIINTTIASTKSAGPLASCYAIMNHLGREGYEKIVTKCRFATELLKKAIEHIPALHVVGRPEMNLIALGSNDLDVFVLAERMKAKGWFIQPQLGYKGLDNTVHLSIGMQNVDHMQDFILELRDSVYHMLENGQQVDNKLTHLSNMTIPMRDRMLGKNLNDAFSVRD